MDRVVLVDELRLNAFTNDRPLLCVADLRVHESREKQEKVNGIDRQKELIF